MEYQIHASRSVHLTYSWTLSKTVHFGRLRYLADAVIIIICDVNVARGIHCYAIWVISLLSG